MIHVVVPMAGLGSRFSNAGYNVPKPFIDVFGKSMIEHVLDNLNMDEAKFILVVRKEHVSAYSAYLNQLKQLYDPTIICIDHVTEGAACTVLYCHHLINNETPLLIANSDQIVDINLQHFINDAHKRDLDGSILTFPSNHPKWSYAALDTQNLVTFVREKEVVSPYATVGIYYFKSGKQFVDGALDMIVRNDRVNNEFYVCPIYNYLIENKKRVGIYNITEQEMHGLGTPEDLNVYKELMKK